MSPRIRDSLAAIHQRTLELIVRGAPLQDVLGALCDGIDALDPDLISSVLLTDAGGQHLWPAAGRRVPEDYKELITPLPIGPAMGACGTAAFRKEHVISSDIATDSLWSGPAEKYRRMALQDGLHTAWSVPIVSENGTLLGTFGLHHTKAHPVAGDELALLEQAEHIALIAIERDRAQTALTEALAEVRKSEAELRTIVDMIPQLIAVLAPDVPDPRAVTARTRRGHPVAGRVSDRAVRDEGRQTHPEDQQEHSATVSGVRLARQYPRTAERGRARRHSVRERHVLDRRNVADAQIEVIDRTQHSHWHVIASAAAPPG